MTTPVHSALIDHPAAWRAADLPAKDDLAVDLGHRHIEALERALAGVKKTGLSVGEIGRGDFPLDEIADDIAAFVHDIHHGRGFILLRGIPVERYDIDDLELLYWGLGTHFGRGVSQSVLGDMVGHVTDCTADDPHARAYRNPKPLPLHTDYNEIIAMLSVHRARRGGKSQYASALTIHNEIQQTRPDLLAPLYEGFHYHRRGENLPDESSVTPHKVPVFCNVDGVVSCRIVPGYVQAAAKEMGVAVPAQLEEALELFDELSRRPDIMLEMMLEPGELHIQNNFTLLHARSGFEDGDDAAEKRLLLRLWLEPETPRPHDPNFQVFSGDAIARQHDRLPSYAGDAFDEKVTYRQ